MALGVAIMVLVVLGAATAAAVFSGLQEQRVGENVRRAVASFGVAEEGAYDLIRGWSANKRTYDSLYTFPAPAPAPSTVAINRTPSANGTGSYWGALFKLNDETYLVDITAQDAMSFAGRVGGGGASQRIGMLVRTKPLVLPPPAALVSGGSNVLTGQPTIDGSDHIPPGWTDCAPADSTRVGVRMELNDTVKVGNPGDRPRISGNPPALNDPALTDSAFSVYGDVTYAQLAGRADITLSAQNFSRSIEPATVGGACNTTAPTNWGSPSNPTGPCGQYFPIVHITGTNTVINGQEGQGILLVDGSLSVQGGFQFFGVAIIRGALRTSGGGGNPAQFWGTVLVQDSASVADTTNNLTGSTGIQYSKCAIVRAFDRTAVVTQLRSRGWTQLF